MTTQNAVDSYTRTMVDAFDEKDVVGVSFGMAAWFGRVESGSRTVFSPDSGTVDIDIIRANERTAALVPRGINATLLGDDKKNTRTQQFTNFSRVFPLAEEEGNIEATKLTDRRAGEAPYQGTLTREDRLKLDAMEQHAEHIRRMARLFERLATSSIMTGTMPAILGATDPDLIYDFKRLATHNETLGTTWTGAADIMQDIDDGCRLIRIDSKLRADFMLLGSKAMKAFLADSDVKEKADNRRFELIRVSDSNPVPDRYMRFVDAGLEPRGMLRTPAGYTLWMFTYVDGYTNDAGTFVEYMHPEKVLIASTQARCDRYFGPADVLPLTPQEMQMYRETFGFDADFGPMPDRIKNPGGIITPEMFHFDAYRSNNRKSLTIRTQAAPIFATTHTDGFYVIENAGA